MSGHTLTDRLYGAPRVVKVALLLASLMCALSVNVFAVTQTRELRDREAFAATAEVLYVPDMRQLRLLSLGYRQTAADFIWVRLLNYFDAHFRGDRQYRWLEHFIEQIVALDPHFTKIYHWAGTNVLYGRRFTNENVLRSNRFYEMALKQDPNDYEAAYRLGLNFYVEMKSQDPAELRGFKEQGLEYLERAANTPGAPGRVANLVAAISSKLGKEQLALQYLVDVFLQTEDPATKEDLRKKIDRLRRDMSGGSMTSVALAFDDARKAHFPYASPGLYTLMGEPKGIAQRDVPWSTLLPGVDVETDDSIMQIEDELE